MNQVYLQQNKKKAEADGKKILTKISRCILIFFSKKKAGSAGEKSVWKSAGEIRSQEGERRGA